MTGVQARFPGDPAGRDWRWWAGLAALAAPAGVYLACLVRNSTDVPRSDDFISILPFLNHWTQAASLHEKLELVFSQYFSHRIVLTKIVALLQWRLTGRCNFLQLQATGWMGWIGVAAGLTLLVPAVRRSPGYGLPVVLALMQPQGFTNMHVGMQAVQNIGVVALALGALIAAQAAGRRGLVLTILLAAAAALASVNGLLVFPAAAAGLWCGGRRRRALVLALVGLAAAAGYFRHYALGGAPFQAGEFIANAGVMAGGFIAPARFPLWAVGLAGWSILAAAGWRLLDRRSWELLPVHAAFVLFCSLSIALAAAGRMGFGPGYMIQDRYRLYGLMIVACLFLFQVQGLAPASRRKFAAWSTAGATAFCLASYAIFLPQLETDNLWGEATALNWQLGRAFPIASPESQQEAADQLARAESRGIYRLPRLLSPRQMAALRSPPDPAAGASAGIRATANGALYGYLLTPARDAGADATRWALLTTEGGTLVLPRLVRPAQLALWRQASPFTDPCYLLPYHSVVADCRLLSGIVLLPDGGLRILWTASADHSRPYRATVTN
jgi:hypothetical protein